MREEYRLWTYPVVVGSGQRLIRDDAAGKPASESPAPSERDGADRQTRDALALLLLGVLAGDERAVPDTDGRVPSAADRR
jgi:hypothetical protein